MKIVIVGCGKIGKTIISSLVKERHDVVAVDINGNIVEDVRNAYDIMTFTGNGTEYATLKECGADKAELFVAVTASDELNMLSCFAAKKMGAKHTVARIRDLENNDESFRFMKDQLDLSLAINPERMTAEAIFNVLRLPSATKVELFPHSKLELIELQLKEHSPLNGLSLIDLRRQSKLSFLVCAVERDGEIFIPSGTFTLKSGDKIGIIAKQKEVGRVLRAINVSDNPAKNVIILGAGTTSTYLAQLLIASKRSVKLIDKERNVCEEVCEALPNNATVINGDGRNEDLLAEEGVLSADAFVTLTGMDETNILMAFYAKSKNVHKVVAKANRNELISIAESIGLDCIVSPQTIVADLIVKYARAIENCLDSQIETLYSVMNGLVEAMEFKVLNDFKYSNVPLKDVKFYKDVLIAGISRNKESFIPGGDDVILPDDTVIIITKGKRILSLSDIIAR